jgi:DNA transposition AAA+ family ATPase
LYLALLLLIYKLCFIALLLDNIIQTQQTLNNKRNIFKSEVIKQGVIIMKAESEIMETIHMAKERNIQTSIRVPESKYEVLEEIKKLEDTSISALVLEGIDRVIADRKPELTEKMRERNDLIKKVLDEL